MKLKFSKTNFLVAADDDVSDFANNPAISQTTSDYDGSSWDSTATIATQQPNGTYISIFNMIAMLFEFLSRLT